LNGAALVQLATAHGIDLVHVAGVASNMEGIARERPRNDIEREMGIGVRLTARGRETRTRRPGMGFAELGQAAAGLGVIPWTAALYSFAGSQDGYWVLWQALSGEANKIARREMWAPRVVGEHGEQRFYREALAQLVLDADAHQHLFAAAPALYAAYMNVAPPTWERQLAGPFASLKGRYDGWLAVARSVIGKWVRSED
jgi:hypothetical protein